MDRFTRKYLTHIGLVITLALLAIGAHNDYAAVLCILLLIQIGESQAAERLIEVQREWIVSNGELFEREG